MKMRILEAAAQELNERGVKFTVDSVAARLGISKKTLYQYYSSKDELISCIVAAVIEDMSEQEQTVLASAGLTDAQKLVAILHIDPRRFGRINDWVLEDVRRYRPADWAEVERFRQNHSQIIASLLESGAASGELRAVHAPVAAQMLRGAVSELMDYQFLARHNLTLHDAMQAVADIFLRGVLKNPHTATTQDGEI